MSRITPILLGLALCLGATGAVAEPMTLDAVLSPKDHITLAFQDGSRQSVSLTQREGTADGDGVFAGASVLEYGIHDVRPGESADANGYLEATTTDGDIAYFQYRLRAYFVAGPDGGTSIINNGHWELAGGTGQFEAMRGVGTIRLEFVTATDRRFVLEGDISPAS